MARTRLLDRHGSKGEKCSRTPPRFWAGRCTYLMCLLNFLPTRTGLEDSPSVLGRGPGKTVVLHTGGIDLAHWAHSSSCFLHTDYSGIGSGQNVEGEVAFLFCFVLFYSSTLAHVTSWYHLLLSSLTFVLHIFHWLLKRTKLLFFKITLVFQIHLCFPLKNPLLSFWLITAKEDTFLKSKWLSHLA